MTTSPDKGSTDAAPYFPTVEGGAVPVEDLYKEIEWNHFFVAAMASVSHLYRDLYRQNLIREALEVFGNASFTYWENPIGACFRIRCTQEQLKKFTALAKESARIWGAPDGSLSVYRANAPTEV